MNSTQSKLAPSVVVLERGASKQSAQLASVTAFLFALLGLLAWTVSKLVQPDDWWVHGGWCVIAAVLLLYAMSRVLRGGIGLMLLDHSVMFSMAFGLYFIFGAALLAFGPEEQIAASMGYYPIDAVAALYADSVNSFGFALALATAAWSPAKWIATRTRNVAMAVHHVPAETAILSMAIVGTIASAYVVTFDLGIQTGEVIAGGWRVAGNLTLVATFLSFMYVGRRQHWIRLMGIAITLAQAGVGLLMLSKSGLILPVAAAIAGFAVQRRSALLVPFAVALLAGMFVSSGGIVANARSDAGTQSGFDLADRVSVLDEQYRGTGQRSSSVEYPWWSRFCYTIPQAASVDLYDAGSGGDDFRLLPWLFLPRVLFPAKPSITETSIDLNEKVSGSRDSSLGAGIFAMGYYNGGWLGVMFASVLCGFIVAQTSAMARVIFETRALLLIPLVLLGVFTAFRIDGHFVADFAGTFVLLLYVIVPLSLAVAAMRTVIRR